MNVQTKLFVINIFFLLPDNDEADGQVAEDSGKEENHVEKRHRDDHL